MFKLKKILLAAGLCFGFLILSVFAKDEGFPSILGLKEQAAVFNRWLKIRLDNILPEVMRREKIDMWIVICREYNEDPVYLTLVPYEEKSAKRLTILIFSDKGKDGIERLSISRYGISDIYKSVWLPEKEDQWQCLAKIIKQKNPERIGINESETFGLGDGLSASLKKKLIETIGPQFSSRLHNAERLAVGWLERRIPEELEVYPQVAAIEHKILREAFSRRVITPGITTTDDIVWWIRERILGLGLSVWVQPYVSIVRFKEGEPKDKVIHGGDLLHCDLGVSYLHLNTDIHEYAYVLKEGEEDAPQGLKNLLIQGNRLQDILIAEFREGRSGNEILAAALKKARDQGLKASIYTHPLGYHGHAAGPTIGLWDNQETVSGRGDYPLYFDTCHSIELEVRAAVLEWENEEVQIVPEQDAIFTRHGMFYLDGRQTGLHIIK